MYLLGRGIITWDDITHTLNATCELPQTFFTEALDKIDETWLPTSAPYKNNLSKLAINSMIGLFANPVDEMYVCKTHEPGYDDTLYEGAKSEGAEGILFRTNGYGL